MFLGKLHHHTSHPSFPRLLSETQSHKVSAKYVKAELFKLLSNPIQFQIIDILSKKETSLEELTETIGIRKPNTSQHLALLRYLRIVESIRVGRKTIYRIINPQ
jgi:DNA-binding transcriptional ArsR family regulator